MNYATQLANRGGDYKANLRTVLLLHLNSAPFLWRLELGGTVNGTQIALTPYEVASRISYMAADTMPDDTLMAAAASGSLSTVAQVQSHVRRMLLTANGKAKTQKNLMRYSLNDKITDFSSLPATLKSGKNVTGLGQAMVDEASQFIDYSLYTQNASFKTLLTSNVSLASNATLASLYGHTPVSSGGTATMSGRRQGLLMRSPFFAISTSRTSIIKRGANFQRRLLCNEIPPPSADIVDIRDGAAFTTEEQLLHSNREVIAKQTSPQLCMSCHDKINATGFAMENLDPFGGLRTEEQIFDANKTLVRTVAVDSSSVIPMPSGKSINVTDAYDLVGQVATSDEGTACFARNAFRYVYERREASTDSCQLSNVQKTVLDSTKPVVDALVDVIANDALFVKQN